MRFLPSYGRNGNYLLARVRTETDKASTAAGVFCYVKEAINADGVIWLVSIGLSTAVRAGKNGCGPPLEAARHSGLVTEGFERRDRTVTTARAAARARIRAPAQSNVQIGTPLDVWLATLPAGALAGEMVDAGTVVADADWT
jgi:hypothetical protein